MNLLKTFSILKAQTEGLRLATISVVAAVSILAILVFKTRRVHVKTEIIPSAPGIPFIGSWAFFTRRQSFLEAGINKYGKIFRFNIIHVRRAYFETL